MTSNFNIPFEAHTSLKHPKILSNIEAPNLKRPQIPNDKNLISLVDSIYHENRTLSYIHECVECEMTKLYRLKVGMSHMTAKLASKESIKWTVENGNLLLRLPYVKKKRSYKFTFHL